MSNTLIAFSQAKPANLLVAYLQSQGIKAQVAITESPSLESEQSTPATQYSVLLSNQADMQSAASIAQDFLNNPHQAKFQESAWDMGSVDTSQSKGGSLTISQWLPVIKQSPLTVSILLLCMVVYALSFLGYFREIEGLIGIRSLPELSQSHKWWRLLGPNFLHFSFMHIAFNLVWWWMLGQQLERSFGTVALLIFVVIASLFANLSQLIISGPNFGGMSGIVYALVGFVWWIGYLRPSWLISLPKNIIYFLLAWLVIGYFNVLWVNMANEAHTFGLISGCLMALAVHLCTPRNR